MRGKIEAWLVGGMKGNALPQNQEANVKIVFFTDVIATARNQLNWLLSEMRAN